METFPNEQQVRDAQPVVDRPDVAEVLGSVFRQETAIGSVMAREGTDYAVPVDGFQKPVSREYLRGLPEKYRPYAESFVGLTEAGAEVQKRNLDMQFADDETREAASGLLDFALSVAVQPFDPVNYIPVGGTAFKGASLGTKVVRGARAGFSGAMLQEPILAATQETRTGEEVAMNIGASVVFGMALGGGAHLFDRGQRQTQARVATGAARGPEITGPMERGELASEIEIEPEPQDLSAAATSGVSADDLAIDRVQEGIIKATPGILGPTLRVMKSQSLAARNLILNMAENFLSVQGVDDGKLGVAIETRIKSLAQKYETFKERAMRDGFTAYLEETGGPSVLKPIQRARAQREYSERVARALRRDDLDPESEAVTEAAKAIREQVLGPFLERAQSNGLIPEGYTVKTALSYFTRAWDQNALSAKQGQFVDVTTNWFRDSMRAGMFSQEEVAQMRLADAEARLRDATEGTGGDGPTQVEIDAAKKELRELRKEASTYQKYPVIESLKKAGGIAPDSVVADELRAMGINQRSVPGLFRKAGLREIDNIDTLDMGDLIRRDGNYLDRQDILDAIRDEFAGNARRFPDQEFTLRQIEELGRFTEQPGSGPSAKVIKDLEAEIENLRSGAGKAEPMSADEIDLYAREAAQGVWDTLTGRDGGYESPVVALVQGPLKGRTFMIPDALVEDFLNNDAYDVLSQYVRTMSAEMELKEQFGRADMRDQIKAVNEEYDALKDGLSEAEAVKLDKERDKIVESIEAVRDRLRGTYLAKENGTTLATVARASNAFNFVRMLGDVVLSSAPDAFRLAQVHGISNLLGPQGLRTIGTSVRALRKAGVDNWMRDEAELAGIAEVYLNTRVQAMADLQDPYAGTGQIETFMRGLANVGSLASGVNHWNQMWKQVTFQHGVQRFKRIAEAGYDNAKPKDRKWLKTLKVSRTDFDKIARELMANGQDRGGLWDANTKDWGNSYARDTFRAALLSDADSVVVTPGAGDKPLFADHPIGAMAFQFKSFFAATHQRALMRGMAEDHVDFLTGASAMIAMGMAVYYMKGLSGNFETSDNPGVWIAEGIDRSGILSVPMEVNNMLEPSLNRAGAGGVYTGLSALMGDNAELSSRYRFRSDPASAILGPSASTLRDGFRLTEDLLRAANPMAEKDGITEGTVGAGARMLPFANHPGMKQFLRYFAIPEAKEAVQ